MYYFLTVGYDIGSLALDESSYLYGPYQTAEARNKAVGKDLGGRDLETDEIVNVTKLKIEDGKLVKEDSFLASEEHQDDEDEDDEE